ncbi:MAG: hypothetical protein HC850_18360 [Rhodomicrobium sp.]|nr:hypothetical protein [Rhodomicrobium sp.]
MGEKVPDSLKNLDLILFCIPPGFRRGDEAVQKKMHIDFFEQVSRDTYVIYTSSTSVYEGEGVVDEQSSCSGPVFELENYIRNRFQHHLILRLGGLAGADRHIVGHIRKEEKYLRLTLLPIWFIKKMLLGLLN